jgi:hypothetical protein
LASQTLGAIVIINGFWSVVVLYVATFVHFSKHSFPATGFSPGILNMITRREESVVASTHIDEF